MNQTRPIVTIDGPAGVGKSTVAKRVAEALQRPYLDTGAMFRLLALNLGEKALELSDSELRAQCMAFSFQLDGYGENTVLLCNNQPLDERIRTESVATLASKLAAKSLVRDYLKTAQALLGESTALVAEGRDMGTVVFPQAEHKFFLDASPEVRAERRTKELIAKGERVNYEDILRTIQTRDAHDRNRPIAPLKAAEDAHIVDTSRYPIDVVTRIVLGQIHAKPTKLTKYALNLLNPSG